MSSPKIPVAEERDEANTTPRRNRRIPDHGGDDVDEFLVLGEREKGYGPLEGV